MLIDVSQLSQQQTDDQTEIPEDEWAVGLELWAAEYLKGEGESHLEYLPLTSRGIFPRVTGGPEASV